MKKTVYSQIFQTVCENCLEKIAEIRVLSYKRKTRYLCNSCFSRIYAGEEKVKIAGESSKNDGRFYGKTSSIVFALKNLSKERRWTDFGKEKKETHYSVKDRGIMRSFYKILINGENGPLIKETVTLHTNLKTATTLTKIKVVDWGIEIYLDKNNEIILVETKEGLEYFL
mgnify:CR=1 FL=1